MARFGRNEIVWFLIVALAWGALITLMMFVAAPADAAPHTFQLDGTARRLDIEQGGPCWSHGDQITVDLTIDLDDQYRTWTDQRRLGEAVVNAGGRAGPATFTFARSVTLPPQPNLDTVGYLQYDIGDNTNARIEFNTGLYTGKMIWSHPGYGQLCEGLVDLTWTPEPPIIGDANFDGLFDSADLIQIMQAGKYDTGFDAGWSQGDWTGDNRFTSSDLVAAFGAGTYRDGAAAVPEAAPEVMIALAALMCVAVWRQP